MRRLIPFLMLLLAACQGNEPSPTASPPSSPLEASPVVMVPTMPSLTSPIQATTVPPTQTVVVPTLEGTPSPTDTGAPPMPGLTASPDLASYEPYTIDFLRSRAYGGGNIEIIELMEETDSFTRYRIRYPSDGLNIYGFANVPKAEGPFPVLVALHGYVDPAIYQTLDYTTSALDVLAGTGYIVIHPDLRGYPPSDSGDNLFRVGMAIDVLNLLALLKSESGPPELFATAAPEAIGIWAHSMGGNIALRVLTVSSDIKAAVLFASLSGDELKNAEVLFKASGDPAFQTELATSPAILERISPMYYYGYITTPIQLQHGAVDQTVPVAWAEETCNAITAMHVEIECIYYPTEDHTFRSRVAEQVSGAMHRFYETYLAP